MKNKGIDMSESPLERGLYYSGVLTNILTGGFVIGGVTADSGPLSLAFCIAAGGTATIGPAMIARFAVTVTDPDVIAETAQQPQDNKPQP